MSLKISQITKTLKKKIDEWDFDKAIANSNNETRTRDYLIEPFLNILGYSQIDDYHHEHSIKIKGSICSMDMVIMLQNKNCTNRSIISICKSDDSRRSLYSGSHRARIDTFFNFLP